MTNLAVGQTAPAFELPRDGGATFRLSDHHGKPVAIYFYPQDDTETCTAEAISCCGAATVTGKSTWPLACSSQCTWRI